MVKISIYLNRRVFIMNYPTIFALSLQYLCCNTIITLSIAIPVVKFQRSHAFHICWCVQILLQEWQTCKSWSDVLLAASLTGLHFSSGLSVRILWVNDSVFIDTVKKEAICIIVLKPLTLTKVQCPFRARLNKMPTHPQ